MNKTDKKTTNLKKKKSNKYPIFLYVGILIVVVPLLIFMWILLSAYINTGKPINGHRFANDLDPAIENSQITTINDSIKGISGVEKVDIILRTATFRVYVDVKDDISSEDAKNIVEEAYQKVKNVLDEKVYFTSSGSKKMYDLEVHVFNMSQRTENKPFVYYILNKNSAMSEAKTQLVSEPINPDLAKKLRGEKAQSTQDEAKTEAAKKKKKKKKKKKRKD